MNHILEVYYTIKNIQVDFWERARTILGGVAGGGATMIQEKQAGLMTGSWEVIRNTIIISCIAFFMPKFFKLIQRLFERIFNIKKDE